MLKRFGMFAATSVLALMVLAACGSGDDDEAEPTVTRMPAENAPQVTATAAEEEEEEAETPAASSPAAGSPVASPAASPVAGDDATPVAEATTPATEAASPTASTPIASPPISETTTAQEPIVVDMVDIAFNPKEITIPANTDVVISLPNKGVTTHNFHVDALGVESGDVAAGSETTVTINAAPGEYEYYCSIPGHKQAGMVGKLIVQ